VRWRGSGSVWTTSVSTTTSLPESAVADPRRPVRIDDVTLEGALRDLGSAIAYPAGHDLAPLVGDRLRREAGRRFPALGGPRGLRLALLLATALLVLLAAGVAAAALGLPGIRITFIEGPVASATATPRASLSPSSPPPAASSSAPTSSGPPSLLQPFGYTLGLGRPIDPASLDTIVGRHVPLPQELGPPPAAWLDTSADVPVVSLVWPVSATLPGSRTLVESEPDIGAILTELPATIEVSYLQKVLGPDTALEQVSIGGQPGFWISGAPHELLLLGPDGSVVTSQARLAGNTLLWEQEGLTLRFESYVDRARAVAIASSVR
jgi:hypothetical protein